MAEKEFLTTDALIDNVARVKFGNTNIEDLRDIAKRAASDMVYDYCRRDFKKIARTEIFGSIRNMKPIPFHFWVKEAPIDEAQSFEIKISINRNWNVATALLPLDDDGNGKYSLDAVNGKITMYDASLFAPDTIRVVYTGGYAVNGTDPNLLDVPLGVQQATALQASWLIERICEQEIAQTRESSADGDLDISKQALGGLVPESRLLLNPYRKPLLGSM